MGDQSATRPGLTDPRFLRMTPIVALILASTIAVNHALYRPMPLNRFVPAHCRTKSALTTTVSTPLEPALFVRTHKTGSSTITAILHRLSDEFCAPVFVACRNRADFFTRTWNLTLSQDRERFQSANVRLRTLTFFSDHVVWNAAARLLLPPRFVRAPTVFTVLRHPIDQFRSACQFWSEQWRCNFTAHVQDRMRARAPLRSGAPWFSEQFFNQFLHFEPRESVHDDGMLVLISEMWETSMVALAHATRAPCAALRVRELKLNSVNVAPHHIDVGADEQQWLESQLADDIADYERAVLRLVRHAAALPASFRARCLAEYRSATPLSMSEELEWTNRRCDNG